jgi:tricorn protease
MSPAYLRMPAIAGDRLAFVADDDVWTATTEGGTASRLTSDHAAVNSLALSPDGDLVAYGCTRDAHPEVYVVETAGGVSRRLTYWGDPSTRVIGWLDGHPVATTTAGQPSIRPTWAYLVPVDGGPPERLPYGPVSAMRRGPTGAVVVGINQSSRRGAAWKRYRGGSAAALWLDSTGGGTFERFLTELDGQLEDPCWVGERVAFVSDHEGWGNVYSVDATGGDLRRHTDHGDHYARAASSDGTHVVYQCAGDIWLLDELTADSQPRLLEIELGSARHGTAPVTLDAKEHLNAFAPGREGRGSAVEVRGSVFWLTHRDGPARHLGGGDGVRARTPHTFGPKDAQLVAWVTDADGEDAVEVAPVTGGEAAPRRFAGGQLGRVGGITGSPDGSRVAVAANDGRVIVIDLADGALQTLEQGVHDQSTGLAFSPDSKWLAWSRPGPEPLSNIRLARLSDGECVDATPLRFGDTDPVFSMDGKYLVFLSSRTFDPVYDAHVFDMSFAGSTRPYLVTLAASTPSPFEAEPDGRPRRSDDRDGTSHAVTAPAPVLVEVTVDIEGLHERLTRAPVVAGHYTNLRAVEDGVAFLREPSPGVLGEDGAKPDAKSRAALVRLDFEKGRELELLDALDSFEVSGDGRSVVVRDGDRLRVLPADRRENSENWKDGGPPGDVVDEVDLSRVRVRVDPVVEWRQMYDEAARLMRDHFWVEDMSGVDWAAAVARYRPLVERLSTRDDLSELIWEVQGELGTSHAYESQPARHVEDRRKLGFLGGDFERDAGGTWRVARILPGEVGVPSARSPLRAPGAGVAVGDAITAIDGRPVDPAFGPAASLVGAADKPVELLVQRDGAALRRVAVTALADDRSLRYLAWVAEKRAAVHEATAGRVGYLHVPDMMGYGWAEMHRDLNLEIAREALIVDVRHNRGGHTSELVLEKLGRRVLGWDTVRHGQPQRYPHDAPRGPIVAITDFWAGSDGDIITATFKLRKLGPVVGTRTWGGVIGIDGRYDLVDRSMVTQPRYSFWFEELGWGVENHGVDPDVEVQYPPQDWAAGRDPQLEEGLRIVLAALETEPVASPPDLSSKPSRVPPALPPRA